jgi:predicted transcriptional regulator
MDILKTIRKEFKTCGLTRYQIAKDTGIEQAVLCRIAKGKNCKAETASILLRYFGYKISKKG